MKRLIYKIRSLFCKHLNFGNKKYYYDDVKYNEHFNTVQAMEHGYRYCLNCGKRIETNTVRWVTLKGIEEEVTERYKKDKKSKII